jgi:plastocyanin
MRSSKLAASSRKPFAPRLRRVLQMPERRPIWIAVALVLLSALVLATAACGGDSNGGGESEGGKKMIAGVEANDHGQKDVSGETGKVEVELDDDYFEPTVLKGMPGQKVTLELKNEGGAEHNISIAEQNVDQDVEPGDEAEVEVTFPQSGELSFVCKYHESAGMAGALVVS